MTTRIEKDSMGPLAVPADAYYGVQTQRAVTNFPISGWPLPPRFIHAMGRIKRAVQSGADLPFESALAVERELQQLLFQGEDAKEGLAAYIEKRPGVFKGR